MRKMMMGRAMDRAGHGMAWQLSKQALGHDGQRTAK